MNLLKNPLDNIEYSKHFLTTINKHIDYFGVELWLLRSIIDSEDSEYNRYQITVDKRRKYSEPEEVRGIVDFTKERPKLTTGDKIFQDTNTHIPCFFKTTDAIKKHDIIVMNYTVLQESKTVEYEKQDLVLEVAEIIDYGYKFTNQMMYKLVMARDKDLLDAIKNHTFGTGAFGDDSQFGGTEVPPTS